MTGQWNRCRKNRQNMKGANIVPIIYALLFGCMIQATESNQTETTTTMPSTSLSPSSAKFSSSTPGGSTSPSAKMCNMTYTMHNEDDRTCIPGMFVCTYGICDAGSGMGCICDPGATGTFCEQECCLDCGEHGNCFRTSTGEAICNCDYYYKGDRCDQLGDPVTTLPSGGDCLLQCGEGFKCTNINGVQECVQITTTTKSTPTTPKEETVSAVVTESTTITHQTTTTSQLKMCNKTYTMHNEDNRTCIPGMFVCTYGICNAGSGIGCICDPGATGTFCEQECCLDCGEHGNCFRTSSGEVICNCDYNYKGDRCDQLRDPVTTSSPGGDCLLQCGDGLECTNINGSQECVQITTIRSTPTTPKEETVSAVVTESTTMTQERQTTTSSPVKMCNKTYTMHNEDDRTCIANFFVCTYGICDQGAGLGCICDPGATGTFCEQECCLDCGEHGHCRFNSLNKEQFCNCEHNYHGDRCEEKREPPPTSTPANCSLVCPLGYVCTIVSDGMSACMPESTTPPALISSSSDTSDTLCGERYKMRNVTERKCPGGLVCIWGYCVDDGGSMYCECDDGAHGLICENACCKQCGVNGTCFYDALAREEICNCYNGYTGDFCDDIRTTPTVLVTTPEDKWYLWVVGGCVGALVLLIILFIVLGYVMWRHRVILVMKIVHYFQGYEDDDEREWDAFISYKSDPQDEDFVVKVLFPTLERHMGFKTHVHFRDFIPGDTIANNIIRAVQGSRRTILVITPNFVKSEFTKFEYQVAQQEMLKHKHRIIPILFDDISDYKDVLDPNLKVILGSVTYLEWPEEKTEKKLAKFWKRLQLSLPKKRVPAEAKDEQGDRKNPKKFKFPRLIPNRNPDKIQNNNEIVINVPDDGDDGEKVYDKIDDQYLDERRDVKNENRENAGRYVDILEWTRL